MGLLAAVLVATLAAGTTAAPGQPPPPDPPLAEPGATAPAAPGADRPARARAFAWLQPAAARLVRAGVWRPDQAADLARDATRGELDDALAALGGYPVPRGPDASAPVSMWAAHLLAVRSLGLTPEMRALNTLATDDGRRLRLPRNFGSEVLARELGLVVNHPADRDHLERARRQPMRAADLAHMLDQLRDMSSWRRERMTAYRGIRLPAMSEPRRRLVEAALAQVGMPYVWGGDWPTARSPWGAQARGGFDCSGLVWWTFKGAPGGRQMNAGPALRGRTADVMAFESPRERIAHALAAPADLVFFGPQGPRSPRGSIGHMAVALGGGWIVHSAGSRGGVSVSHLDAYWPSATAFARRLPEPV
jgi:hypothetical protein